MPAYLTKQEFIPIAGAAGLTIRSLLDRNQFDDPLGDAAHVGISSATWSLFGLNWPSGMQLAARMAARTLRTGERILEIGCGLALPSLVGHRKGCNVTASDCHPLVAEFLLENIRLNGLMPLPYQFGQWGETATSPNGSILTAPAGVQERSFMLPAVVGHFDLIIGSDILYERDTSGSLAGFIAKHAAPGAEVWIVDPDRSNRAAFNQRMAAQGYQLQEERLDAPASVGAAAYKGRLLVYSQNIHQYAI